jgi:4-hydroxy-3-methylbut-2-en-1-yl diphosphate synthase IspG/GcpE
MERVITPSEVQQASTLEKIETHLRILRLRLPLVADYWVDLEDMADSLEAMIEATED